MAAVNAYIGAQAAVLISMSQSMWTFFMKGLMLDVQGQYVRGFVCCRGPQAKLRKDVTILFADARLIPAVSKALVATHDKPTQCRRVGDWELRKEYFDGGAKAHAVHFETSVLDIRNSSFAM